MLYENGRTEGGGKDSTCMKRSVRVAKSPSGGSVLFLRGGTTLSPSSLEGADTICLISTGCPFVPVIGGWGRKGSGQRGPGFGGSVLLYEAVGLGLPLAGSRLDPGASCQCR